MQLKNYMTEVQFDKILSNFEKYVLSEIESGDGIKYLYENLNPVKCSLQIFQLLETMSKKWEKGSLRVKVVKAKLLEAAKEFLDSRYLPNELRM